MALIRRCTICGKKLSYGIKCECEVQNKKDRYKEYKASRNDKDRQKFYSSTLWTKCRENRLSELYYIDWLEFYSSGRIILGDILHHIETTEDNMDMALVSDNLIYLTDSSHKKVHGAYGKSKKDKEKMQGILKEVLRRFGEDFI